MSGHRVPNRGRVDHGRPVRFTFDGRSYQGLAGDTLASALLANGVHLMGRSFKYHRPRGVVSAGSDEPNALMGTRRGPGRFEPNTRATIQELRDGLEADKPEPLAVARLRCRRGQRPPRLDLLGRLLLQDLHVAEVLLGPGLRARRSAARRASARRRPSPTPTATPPASPMRTSSWSAPGPPASPRRSPPAAPVRRSSSSRRPPSRAARFSPNLRSSSTASPPGTGSLPPSASSASCRTSR